jgi:hypothetical protein
MNTVAASREKPEMGLHNDQACSDQLADGLSSRREVSAQQGRGGWFAGAALASSRIDAAA